MASNLTLYFGVFVHLPRAAPNQKHELEIQHGALWVSAADGRIKGFDWSVKTESDLGKLLETISQANGTNAQITVVRANAANNEFFFPGFIDTHIHAPQYPNTGLFGSSTLLDWLNQYTFPLETSFFLPRKANAVYKRVIDRTLANGTTCASYFATIHVPATKILANLCKQRGQRALIGRVCMDSPDFTPPDYRDESPEDSIALTEQIVTHVQALDPNSSLVQPIVTPRFAPACTPTALRDLGILAASYYPPLHIQTHLSENKDEVALVKTLFPNSKSYTDVYDTYDLLTPRTILAHAIWLSKEERDLIHSRRAKISHCPASNSALGSGLCPVRRLLDSGITVGLGTDVSGGYDASILENVRQACLVSRLVRHTEPNLPDEEARRLVLSVDDALYLATRGGAAVVDMEDKIGGFDVGLSWDTQLITLGSSLNKLNPNVTDKPNAEVANSSELEHESESPKSDSRVDIFGTENWHEKIEKWVWSGDDRNVKTVWVNGKMVHSRPENDASGDNWDRDLLLGFVVGFLGVAAFALRKRMR